MKKELSLYHLAVVAVFIGILISCAIFYFTESVLQPRTDVADSCLDGSSIEGERFVDNFNRAVYQSIRTQEKIRSDRYRLFGIVDDGNVISGKHNFLFEIYDEENNYSFLDDYLGKLTFTENEKARILSELQRRKASYAERDAEYFLVILPNAQTVYHDYMPAYLGGIRQTRWDDLEAYLTANGFTDFADLSQSLTEARSEGMLYNNTENSLNALGLYCAYRSVCGHFDPAIMEKTRVIPRGDLSFYQHLTTGKAVARRAGLSDVVLNLTVSLSDNTKSNYRITQNTGLVTQTVLLPFEYPVGVNETPRLLLQFSNEWERLQLEPFFSNTFSNVTYQTNLADDAAIFAQSSPRVVIQFIYENELSWLLPH